MKEPENKPAPSPVSLKKVAEEIGALPNEEWSVHLNRRTGELYTVTVEDADALEDPDDPNLEDWQKEELPKVREVMESADWVVLPSKFDIHEYDIMKQFCLDLPDGREREALLDAIHGRGAFRRFKDLVHRYGIQQQWYDFRDREVERIVADWLDTQEIAYER
jgi:hypothetical protein